MSKRCLHLVGALCALSSVAHAESVITYESHDDLTPDDPSIDICVDCVATIEIWLTPTDGVVTGLSHAGFNFEGTLDDGEVTNGGIVLSDYRWGDPFQNPGNWFIADSLPSPEIVTFCCGELVPLTGLLLATVTVHGTHAGAWPENTNPTGFDDQNISPIPLASGSDLFVVLVDVETCNDPLAKNDCNENGVLDACDVADGISNDCNDDLRPDECDLADGLDTDCNVNGVLDNCDLASGRSADDNYGRRAR
jgi:hypothetical protein